MPNSVTIRQCVLRGHIAPDMLGARMREMLRFGVRRFLLPPDLQAQAALLPLPAKVDIRSEGEEARFLVCGGPHVFTGNLAPLLRDSAADPPTVLARHLEGEAGHATGIMACRPGFDPDADAPATVATGRGRLSGQRPALFLDRDGVLNLDHGYVATTVRWEWMPGALDAVRLATDLGWHVFVVTNQSGIARGLYTEDDARRLLDWMQDEARRHGGTIDDVRYCPYHPQATLPAYRLDSDWRKPGPGMLLSLMKAWDLHPARCLMVGDKPSDLQAAEAAGMQAHLFPGGNLAEFLIPLLADAHRVATACLSRG